jgi:murein DD-endopeptidase MepM/ murein hydrolase activator NlpD
MLARVPSPGRLLTTPRALGVAGVVAVLGLTGAGLAQQPDARIGAASTPAAAASLLADDDQLFALSDAAEPEVYADGNPLALTGAVRWTTEALQMRADAAAKQRAAAKALAERKKKAAARAAARKAWVRSFTLPVPSFQLSARFGDRGGWSSGHHTGLDFRAPYGTRVMAVADARVLRTTYHPAYGKMIVLDIGRGITVWYCHLASIEVSPGEKVDVGERIGSVGMTGNTSGPHLHLEVRKWDQPTDPTVFFWAKTPGYTGDVPGWVYGARIENLSTL